MANQTAVDQLRKLGRVAGFFFLFTFLFPTINFLLLSKLIVAENPTATASNILADGLLFRIGIINQLIVSVGVIVFALALYILLESANKILALLGLFLKLTEAILWAVVALGHFVALLILGERASLTVFGPEQIQALVGLFVSPYYYVGFVALIFLGLNLSIFLYLIFKMKYVPRTLAGLGIVSYVLLFIYALATILVPGYVTTPIQIIGLVPSILTELILGSWLLVKGISVQPASS